MNSSTNRLYVAENVARGKGVVIDAARMKAATDHGFVARIAVGALPTHLVVDPDSRRVYVNNNGGNSISVIEDRGPDAHHPTATLH